MTGDGHDARFRRMLELAMAASRSGEYPSVPPQKRQYLADLHPRSDPGGERRSGYHGRSVTGFPPGPGSIGQAPPSASAVSSSSIVP